MGKIIVITIRFNNEILFVKVNDTLNKLLEEKGYNKNFYAVALNHHFIPRIDYENILLQENDVIDIIIPMQGG